MQHSGGFGSNGGDSANGAACIDHWLGGQRWDVVTVNFGLHDCDPGRDSQGYAANLATILSKARAAAILKRKESRSTMIGELLLYCLYAFVYVTTLTMQRPILEAHYLENAIEAAMLKQKVRRARAER